MKFKKVYQVLQVAGRPPHGGRGLKSFRAYSLIMNEWVAPRTGGVD